MTSLADTVAAWPKAELHLHLEGSIASETAVVLAGRHGRNVTPAEVRARYSYADFNGFIQSYIWVTSLLLRPQDYGLIARRHFQELIQQNVVYAEVTLSIGMMLWREQDVAANFAEMRAAAEEAAEAGLRVQWIFDVVRQFGPEKAMDVARLAVRRGDEGVVAFGMGGDELAVPAEEFRAVYDYTRGQGLRSLVHAGEIGGAGEVRRAVEILGAERIGHGIGAVQDPAVMQLLRERGIALEVCPTSNRRTGALGRLRGRPGAGLAQHPVAELARAGVPVTLSTDDPGMFETNLIQEYAAAAEAGLTVQELARIALASFDAAFLPQQEKTALAAPLRRTLAAQGLL